MTDRSGEQSDRHGFKHLDEKGLERSHDSIITFPIVFVKTESLLFPSSFLNSKAHGRVKDCRVSQMVSPWVFRTGEGLCSSCDKQAAFQAYHTQVGAMDWRVARRSGHARGSVLDHRDQNGRDASTDFYFLLAFRAGFA